MSWQAWSTRLFSITALVFASLFGLASAYPDGAGACFVDATADTAMFLMHHAGPMYSTGNFSVIASSPSYTPGCTYTVSICYPFYEGFLLYAKTPTQAARVGSMMLSQCAPDVQLHAKYQACPGTQYGTITHNGMTTKPPMHFYWQAPATAMGVVEIHAKIVVGPAKNWYTDFLSLPQNPNVNATCKPPPVSNVCPPFTNIPNMSPSSLHGGVLNTQWSGLTILFPFWTISAPMGYVLSIMCVFAVAMLFELLMTMQRRLEQSALRSVMQDELTKRERAAAALNNALDSPTGAEAATLSTEASSHAVASETAALSDTVPLLSGSSDPDLLEVLRTRPLSKSDGLRAMVHVLRVCLSLCLMVVIMSMDVGLLVASIVGGGAGYLLFPRE